MITQKILFLGQTLCYLFMVSSNTHACHKDDSRNVCSASFYDIEQDKGLPVIEHWNSKASSHEYSYKRQEHSGAMLISHGCIASPVGYGTSIIIKDEKFHIEKYCPTCGSKYERFEGCAFSNCHYRIKGEKMNGDEYKTAWRKVEDFIHVFNNAQKLAEFRHLIFEVRYLNDPPPKKSFF